MSQCFGEMKNGGFIKNGSLFLLYFCIAGWIQSVDGSNNEPLLV